MRNLENFYRMWVIGTATKHQDVFEEFLVQNRTPFLVHNELIYIAKGQQTLEFYQNIRNMVERGETP
jgi:hypothetical protein